MQRMSCAAPPAPAVVFNPPSAFALGSAGGTSCPSGMATVLSPAECQKAAGAAARPYGGAVIVTGLPAGCFWLRVGVGSFFFNNAVGRSNANAQPVCAGAPRVQPLPYKSGVLLLIHRCSCVRSNLDPRLQHA